MDFHKDQPRPCIVFNKYQGLACHTPCTLNHTILADDPTLLLSRKCLDEFRKIVES